MYTDNDISTKYAWGRPHTLSSQSTATISWRIPDGMPDGTYRLRHFGDYKHIFDGTTPFEGASSSFVVGSGLSIRASWGAWVATARQMASSLQLV